MPGLVASNMQADSLLDGVTCGICGRPPGPRGERCQCELDGVKTLLNQAMQAWDGWSLIRTWVTRCAHLSIRHYFEGRRNLAIEAHHIELRRNHLHTIFEQYGGQPPFSNEEYANYRAFLRHREQLLHEKICGLWKLSCAEYRRHMEYYFSLIEVTIPHEEEYAVQNPKFTGPHPHHVRTRSSSRGAPVRGPRHTRSREVMLHDERRQEVPMPPTGYYGR